MRTVDKKPSMRKMFHSIATEAGVEIVNYRSYRSAFGVQVYDITVLDGDKRLEFSDGYFTGSGESEKQKLVRQFKYEINKRFNLCAQ